MRHTMQETVSVVAFISCSFERWSTISPISTKREINSHLNLLNIHKITTYNVGNTMRPWHKENVSTFLLMHPLHMDVLGFFISQMILSICFHMSGHICYICVRTLPLLVRFYDQILNCGIFYFLQLVLISRMFLIVGYSGRKMINNVLEKPK